MNDITDNESQRLTGGYTTWCESGIGIHVGDFLICFGTFVIP